MVPRCDGFAQCFSTYARKKARLNVEEDVRGREDGVAASAPQRSPQASAPCSLVVRNSSSCRCVESCGPAAGSIPSSSTGPLAADQSTSLIPDRRPALSFVPSRSLSKVLISFKHFAFTAEAAPDLLLYFLL